MPKPRVFCRSALFGFLLLAGCHTPPPPTAVAPASAPAATHPVSADAPVWALPPDGQRRAQALAAFANGRIAELNKDSADAAEHYLAAAQLEQWHCSSRHRRQPGCLTPAACAAAAAAAGW